MKTFEGSDKVEPYPSLDELMDVHSKLLNDSREIDLEDTDDLTTQSDEWISFWDKIKNFIQRGVKTGTLLPENDDRWNVQTLLDYWATRLYEVGEKNTDSTLSQYDPTLAPDLPENPCPYLGLESFREESQQYFFGRENFIDKLIKKLKEVRLITIIGSSGSGKSSLVLGGLLPRLKEGKIGAFDSVPDSKNWKYLGWMVPGSRPLDNLVRLLKKNQLDADADTFLKSENYLTQLIESQDNYPTVLAIDQFEELFTLCFNQEVRKVFVDNLIGLINSPTARHIVIVTMRSDYQDYIVQLPEEFQESFNQSIISLPPLNRSELQEAIEEPARKVGLKFDSEIVDDLVEDFRQKPAGLPLLQFTLWKLWKNKERNRVTWQAYQSLGGDTNQKGDSYRVLAKSADAFYDHLLPEEQKTVRRILLKMVRLTEGKEVTSQRIRRKNLYPIGDDETRINKVIEELINERLVRLTKGDTPEDDQVEVAHEALVRNWPTLEGWLDDEKAKLRKRQQLTSAAEQWNEKRKDPGSLWGGLSLAEAQNYDDWNDLEEEFIQASYKKEKKLEKKLEDFAKQKRLRRILIAPVLAVQAEQKYKLHEDEELSLLLACQAYYFYQQSQELLREEDIALRETLTSDYFEGVIRDILAFLYVGQLIREHDKDVSGVAFSPDGKWLVSSGYDGKVVFWNALSKKRELTLSAKGKSLKSIAFNPKFDILATGAHDGNVILWDLRDIENIRQVELPRGHQEYVVSSKFQPEVWALAFSPDGYYLASGSRDNNICLWDVHQPESAPFPFVLKGHKDWVWSVAFSPDGRTLASGSRDRTIRLWELNWESKKFELKHELRSHTDEVRAVAFSPDGSILATGSRDTTVRLWAVEDRKCFKTLEGHTQFVSSLSFSRDHNYLASGSHDQTVIIWNLKELEEPFQRLSSRNSGISSVAFSPDSQKIASGYWDSTVKLWNLDQPGADLKDEGKVFSVAFSPDGKWLASGSEANTVRIWNLERPKTKPIVLTKHQGKVRSVAFSPDGQILASASYDKDILLWKNWSQERNEPIRLDGHEDGVTSIAFSPDEETLASGSRDRSVRLWNWRRSEPIRTLWEHKGGIWTVAFSADGQILASGSTDKTVRLWYVATGECFKVLYGHEGDIRSVAFSPDGMTLASGSPDGTVRLWNLQHLNQEPKILRISTPESGSSHGISSLAFSPDSKRLLAGCWDYTVRSWNLGQPEPDPIILYSHPGGSVSTVAFSSDGLRLASGSHDDFLILVRVVNLADWACQKLHRNLALEEWQKYVGEDIPYQRTCACLDSGEGAPSDAPTAQNYVPPTDEAY